jgi:precorrin-6B methylase 2
MLRPLLFAAICCFVQPGLARDVPFVPTPERVVARMLDVAKVGPRDVVYDLGSGDGRIVIAAAKKGARAIGIDIDPERIREARENARRAGVTKRVEFREGDLFKADFRDATVVTLYLLSGVNLKLRPKLLAELKPGTRIVSHGFDMGDWKPTGTYTVGSSSVYYWVVPRRK